jgi:methylmalonyl-CoA carboxyltransferase large subunit
MAKQGKSSTTMAEKVAALGAMRAELELGGGQERIEKQHAGGKLTARERVARLVDAGSFQEIGVFAKHRSTYFGMAEKEMPADGVVTGCAKIDGRQVHLASQDFTVAGGAAGETHNDKVVDMMRLSLKTGSPFVFINDSGGARVQEGIDSLAGYGRVFYHNVLLSGVVPQISLICGPCAGGAVYSPALTDFVIQTEQARMFITGPLVIKQVTGEVVSAEELGGPHAQTKSGVVHLIARDDDVAVQLCRRLLSFLPANNLEDAPRADFNLPLESDAEMGGIVPVDNKAVYDVRHVITRVLDYQDFFEIQSGFAANIVIGFGRLQGRPVGIIASQPNCLAGVLDINASDKAARFLQRVQYSADYVCGCAGLSSGRGAGAGRDHPPWGEAAVCLFGGHGAEDHGGAAQGVRRRVYCYVLQGSWRGPGGGVADGGDRGDGRGRRSRDCLSAGDRCGSG